MFLVRAIYIRAARAAFHHVFFKRSYIFLDTLYLQARWVGRQWRYTIRWSEAGARVSKNIVMVSSKPRQSVDAVRVSVWTRGAMGASDDIPSGHQLSSPVPVYARVSVGSSPVLGATVYLDVEVENTNGTVFVLLPSLMLDNGHGEPDITGDDGKCHKSMFIMGCTPRK